ncbi:MAG: nucleic acid-binding protein, partial [Thermoplasmata archaeon]
SIVLSGKPLNIQDAELVTTPGVASELRPGGKYYQIFQFLLEKGLTIMSPSKKSLKKVNEVSDQTGDTARLSNTDREILALALDLNLEKKKDVIILTDDYSIQNVAHALKIRFQSFAQQGITKKFKWSYLCPGCGKRFKKHIKNCPICGASTRIIIRHKKDITENISDD